AAASASAARRRSIAGATEGLGAEAKGRLRELAALAAGSEALLADTVAVCRAEAHGISSVAVAERERQMASLLPMDGGHFVEALRAARAEAKVTGEAAKAAAEKARKAVAEAKAAAQAQASLSSAAKAADPPAAKGAQDEQNLAVLAVVVLLFAAGAMVLSGTDLKALLQK
ncbi:unnamed protein product, partial [Prorocentrum cordatum]